MQPASSSRLRTCGSEGQARAQPNKCDYQQWGTRRRDEAKKRRREGGESRGKIEWRAAWPHHTHTTMSHQCLLTIVSHRHTHTTMSHHQSRRHHTHTTMSHHDTPPVTPPATPRVHSIWLSKINQGVRVTRGESTCVLRAIRIRVKRAARTGKRVVRDI